MLYNLCYFVLIFNNLLTADEGTYPIAANRTVYSQSASYEAIVYSPPQASDKEQDSLNTSVLSQTESISNNQTFDTSAQNDSMCISKSSMDELLKNNVNGVCLEESKKKRFMGNRSYFIMKEMLMTERTYRKDLDVIGVLWKEEVAEESGELGELLLSLIKPLTSVHASFLLALELCLQILENRAPITDTSQCTVASVLSNFIPSLMPLYEDYLNGHVTVLEQLNVALQRSSRFEQLHHEFELQKIKHLPFTCFVMKPLYRILHYKNLLDRLLDFYDVNDDDRASCVEARAALTPLLPPLIDTLSYSENLIMLSELQRDVIGFNFSGHVRQFLRLGCLMSYTKKGCQKRMFFLFSDVLLYASKVSNSSCFRACGYMNLKGVMIDEPEKAITKYSFIIYGGNRAITVAANSQEDKDIWLEDLRIAIQHAREQTDSAIPYVDLKSSSSEEAVDQGTLSERTAPRIDTLIQACWHRNKTVGFQDILNSIENHLSGYLLRKFKNSNGWQRLWVVLYSFCLFFYKSSTDEFPLASLPLLGYSIGHPSTMDNISKEFVFKLQFKNHVYFFRTDSEYAFERWMEVIKNTTNNSNIKIGE